MATATVVGEVRRQLVELPPLRLETTEHTAEQRRCVGGGHVTHGAFPPEARGPVSYGPRLLGLAVYLQAYKLLPDARIREVLADLFGCSFSLGTLATAMAKCDTVLAETDLAIHQTLQHAEVAHFDETGLRVPERRSGCRWPARTA